MDHRARKRGEIAGISQAGKGGLASGVHGHGKAMWHGFGR